jgi:hypothetical protein
MKMRQFTKLEDELLVSLHEHPHDSSYRPRAVKQEGLPNSLRWLILAGFALLVFLFAWAVTPTSDSLSPTNQSAPAYQTTQSTTPTWYMNKCIHDYFADYPGFAAAPKSQQERICDSLYRFVNR